MMTLHDLQTAFCRSMSLGAPDELLCLIAGDGFDSDERLGIYRNNVNTRLTDTLSATFPVVAQLVDERFFDYAVRAFLSQELPSSGCLSDFGAAFPAFLAGFEPAAAVNYLADVGMLEWAVHTIRHAAIRAPVPISALASLRGDPAQFKVGIQSTVRFIASPFAVDQIWIAHQKEVSWDGLQVDGSGVSLQIEGSAFLTMSRLEPSIWEFRARLADGQTLGTSIEAALAVSDRFDPPSALAALFSDELVIELTPGK